MTLASISEDTKVGVPLLRGLEADDLSRWPGGIFRRAFIRSYAAAIGLDPDLVLKRVEEEHPSEMAEPAVANPAPVPPPVVEMPALKPVRPPAARKTRVQAALLELLVAGALGLGFAAAGSRLLWPVLAIALYHAAGMVLAGTSPMLALLTHAPAFPALRPAELPAEIDAAGESRAPVAARRPESDTRQRRTKRPRRGPGRPDQNPVRR